MTEAYLCEGARTPIGRYGGALSSVRPDDMLAHVIRHVMEATPGLPGEAIDDVLMGCANQAGEDNRNVARMALLLAGVPDSVPAATINRLCGSGLDAVGTAARAIRAGEAEVILAGGVESMSRAPMVMPKADTAFSRRAEIFDTTIGWRFVNPVLKKQYGIDSMPETAENVAEDFQVSRADQDAFAFRSVRRRRRRPRRTAGWRRRSRRSRSRSARRTPSSSTATSTRARPRWTSSRLCPRPSATAVP